MQEIDYNEFRTEVVSELKKQTGLNVSEFANSNIPRDWGIEHAPASIIACLSTGSLSLPILSIISEKLGIGKLEKKAIRETKYFITRNKKPKKS